MDVTISQETEHPAALPRDRTYVGHDLIHRVPAENEPLESEKVHLNLGLIPPPTIGESATSDSARTTAERDLQRVCDTRNGASSVPRIY